MNVTPKPIGYIYTLNDCLVCLDCAPTDEERALRGFVASRLPIMPTGEPLVCELCRHQFSGPTTLDDATLARLHAGEYSDPEACEDWDDVTEPEQRVQCWVRLKPEGAAIADERLAARVLWLNHIDGDGDGVLYANPDGYRGMECPLAWVPLNMVEPCEHSPEVN
jgi:hypothetical protein